jgi:hypothetical protein
MRINGRQLDIEPAAIVGRRSVRAWHGNVEEAEVDGELRAMVHQVPERLSQRLAPESREHDLVSGRQ